MGLGSWLHASPDDVQDAIQAGFHGVRALRQMHRGVAYTLQVGDSTETGPGDQFLRRRTAREISQSGLSCGCGDNALVFLACVEGRGVAALLVDAAEVSSASLANTFSGHAIVAVRDTAPNADWCLVDTTNLRVISEHWSRDDISFRAFGRLFWIGYVGPVGSYPVHSPAELRQFYRTTLAKIPRQTLSAAIIRLTFSIDLSLMNPNGVLVNPRLAEFVTLQERILREQAIAPTRTVSILLKRGGDDARTELAFSESNGWVANVGTRSACSPSLLDYFEHGVVASANDGGVPAAIPPGLPPEPAHGALH